MVHTLEIESVALERTNALWHFKKLSLGIEIIDAQHAWLVALVMQLEWLLHDGFDNNRDEIVLVSKEALDYTKHHFDTEEALFTHFNYSDIVAHTQKHRKFTGLLSRLLRGEITNTVDAEKLYRLLRSWLVHHIIKEDRGYASLLSNRKLLEDANSYLTELNKKEKLLSEHKYRIYKTIAGTFTGKDVTTAEVITDIKSAWRRLNLQTGVPIIDIQHLWLIKMVVDLDNALSESALTRQAVLAKTFRETKEYIKTHFRTEEELMDVIGYPDREAHSARHRAFESMVEEREYDLGSGNLRGATRIAEELRSWLVNHIAFEDKKLLEAYLLEKRDAVEYSREAISSGAAGVRQNQVHLYKAITQSA